MNLSKQVKITQVLDYQSSATSSKGSDVIDMQGWDGVIVVGEFGTGHASDNYMKMQQGTANSTSGMDDLTGTKLLATSGQKQVWMDLYRPRERYVRVVIARGTASVIYPFFSFRYAGRALPDDNVTAGTINGEVHISPAEGTA